MEPHKALVCNRCVIESFGGFFCVVMLLYEFSLGVGAFVIGLSQISSFFSQYMYYHLLSYLINSSCKLDRWSDVTLHIFSSLTAPVTVVLSKLLTFRMSNMYHYRILNHNNCHSIHIFQLLILLGLNEYLTCDSREYTHFSIDYSRFDTIKPAARDVTSSNKVGR